MNLATIELLILDVDGVLTDGSVTLTAEGESRKTFHVHDGCAIKLWQRCGGRVAILSARAGDAVRRRAAELGIDLVHTGVSNKLTGYESILATTGGQDHAVGYVGDDLPDLMPMSRCGFPVAVADAVPAVKQAASYVTRRPGGRDAVAEVVELLLRKQRRWSRTALMEL